MTNFLEKEGKGQVGKRKEFREKKRNSEANPGLLGRIWGAISKVKENKVVKVLTGSAVSRGVSIALAVTGITLGVLALSGVSIGAAAGFVLAPQVAIPLAVASLGVVAIGAAVDTYMVRKTRLLHSESKHLSRHCLAKDIQDKVLEQNPELSKALGAELYKSEREGKKSVDKRYLKEGKSKKRSLAANIALNISKNIAGGVVSVVEGVITRNPLKVVKAVAFTTIGVGSSVSGEMTMSQKRDEFRKHIDSLRDRNDAPGYNSLTELKMAARKQKIQTLALQELVKDPDYKNYSDEQIKEKFKAIREKIEGTEKAIQSRYRIVNLMRNFGRAHNPFSKYNNPEKLSTKVDDIRLKPKKQKKKKNISEKIKRAARKIKIHKNSNSRKRTNNKSRKRIANARGR